MSQSSALLVLALSLLGCAGGGNDRKICSPDVCPPVLALTSPKLSITDAQVIGSTLEICLNGSCATGTFKSGTSFQWPSSTTTQVVARVYAKDSAMQLEVEYGYYGTVANPKDGDVYDFRFVDANGVELWKARQTVNYTVEYIHGGPSCGLPCAYASVTL